MFQLMLRSKSDQKKPVQDPEAVEIRLKMFQSIRMKKMIEFFCNQKMFLYGIQHVLQYVQEPTFHSFNPSYYNIELKWSSRKSRTKF